MGAEERNTWSRLYLYGVLLLLLGTLLALDAMGSRAATPAAQNEGQPAGLSAVKTPAQAEMEPVGGPQSPTAPDCAPGWVLGPSHDNPVENSYLSGMAAVGGGDVWAVGTYYTNTSKTLVEHWNGSDWSIVPSPNPPGTGSGGSSLTGVAKTSASDVWAVGYYFNMNNKAQTLVERWNGAAWNIISSPNQGVAGSYLNRVASISADDVWAVGGYYNAANIEQTLVEHWNGANWDIVSSPNQGTNSNILSDVAGSGPTGVWAVGSVSVGNTTKPLAEHWDGTAWTIVPLPSPGSTANYLFSVAVRAANDVWAVGYYSNGGNTYATLVEHWNGATWSVMPSPNEASNAFLFDVAIAGANDVWAVGTYGANNNDSHSLVEHWNGSAWSVVPGRDAGPYSNLSDVAVVASGDIWATGSYGANAGETLAEHWDGSAWGIVPTPNAGPLNGNVLTHVVALARNDMWAVGYYDNDSSVSQTLAQHWDGSIWIDTPSMNVQGALLNELWGVSAASANDAWAVGYYETSNHLYQTLAEHWTGRVWNIAPTANVGAGNNFLSKVAVVAPNDVWAVGIRATNNGQQTLVEHWNGAVWSVVPSPNAGLDDSLDGVAVVASNDIWAAGRTHVGGADQTLIEHWNGTAWSLVPSPNPSAPSAQLLDIMVSAPGDIWAVGNYTNNTPALQTLVEHWNGTTWTIVNSPNPGVGANFTSVAGDAADNVWAVGYYFDANQSNTLVEHWDGTTWMIANSPDAGPYPSNLSGVAVVAPDDVWAVGYSYDNVAYQVLTVRYNPCPTSCAITFDDVPAGSTFYPYVRCLACQSIISGYQCGGQGEPCPGAYFRPGNPVNSWTGQQVRGQCGRLPEPCSLHPADLSGRASRKRLLAVCGAPVGAGVYQRLPVRASAGRTLRAPGQPAVLPAGEQRDAGPARQDRRQRGGLQRSTEHSDLPGCAARQPLLSIHRARGSAPGDQWLPMRAHTGRALRASRQPSLLFAGQQRDARADVQDSVQHVLSGLSVLVDGCGLRAVGCQSSVFNSQHSTINAEAPGHY